MEFFGQVSETKSDPKVLTTSKAEAQAQSRLGVGLGATIPVGHYRFSKMYFQLSVQTSKQDRETALWAIYDYIRDRLSLAIAARRGTQPQGAFPRNGEQKPAVFEYQHENTLKGLGPLMTISREETVSPKPHTFLKIYVGYEESVRSVTEEEYQGILRWVDAQVNLLAAQATKDLPL